MKKAAGNDKGRVSQGHLFNLLGISLALGIGFGGLFVVQNRLAREEEVLLQGGGMITVAVQTEKNGSAETDMEETEPVMLTEEELKEAVESLRDASNAYPYVYPHEPEQGQLSMAEAVESSISWAEGFLLPHLGLEESSLQEYGVSCYLLAPQEYISSGDAGGLHLSRWTVVINSRDISLQLVLNAVTGQVLDAQINGIPSNVDLTMEKLEELLYDYAGSFGIQESYVLVDSGEEANIFSPTYLGIGSGSVSACISAGSIVVSRADSLVMEYSEVYNIHLYLVTDISQ